MSAHKISEPVNLGFCLKIGVPTHECPDIEEFVGKFIKITLAGTIQLISELRKVSTWQMKEKGEVIGTYKMLTVEIEALSTLEGVMKFVDKKEVYTDDVEIEYNFEGI